MFKHRAIMLDLARLMEGKKYYFDLLPHLAAWGYSVLHLHLTDDEGCRMVFPSRPELASPSAFSADEMRALVAQAGRHGLEVIPEIESFGHTWFITGAPGYRDLCPTTGTQYNAVDPDHPRTREVLADLFRDAAAIFDSPVIHAGLDEVEIKRIPRYKDADRATMVEVFSRHAAWIHQAIRDAGRRPAMWGDHVLALPEMADKFQKDVLIFDWHYGDVGADTLGFFCERGFETIACPATMASPGSVLTHRESLSNLRHFSAIAGKLAGKGVSGVVNTIWCPYRYLSGAMDWPMALGGHVLSAKAEDPQYAAMFARDFYGLAAADARDCGRLLTELHEAGALPWDTHRATIVGHTWGRPFEREDARLGAIAATQCSRIARELAMLVRKARRNANRLQDVVLSAKVVERLGLYGAANRTRKLLPPGGRKLYEQCLESWKSSGRPWPWKRHREGIAHTEKSVLDLAKMLET